MLRTPGPTKVIVEKSPEQVYAGTFFIPEAARVKPMDGRVVAVGSEVTEVKVGDTILTAWRHGGTQQFDHDGKEYWLLNQSQILAVIG